MPGDYAGEMENRTPNLTPDEAEELLRGRALERDDLFELRDFVRTAAATTRTRPSVGAERRHLAAIAEATRLEPLSAPALRSRSNVMVRSILRSKPFKALAGAVAALVAMGGLAAAQTLPGPAQDAMAEVAERVGIDLPHAKEKRGADHDGDGIADDNGLHTGQTGVKRGADHDGDGVADDNGLHKGQTKDKTKPDTDEPKPDKVKTGKDHDGDGVADDNGKHKGEDNAGDDDEGGRQGDDADESPGNSGKVKENRGQGNGSRRRPRARRGRRAEDRAGTGCERRLNH